MCVEQPYITCGLLLGLLLHIAGMFAMLSMYYDVTTITVTTEKRLI